MREDFTNISSNMIDKYCLTSNKDFNCLSSSVMFKNSLCRRCVTKFYRLVDGMTVTCKKDKLITHFLYHQNNKSQTHYIDVQ